MLRVFIGSDPKEKVARNVAAHSIWESATAPVSVTPLIYKQLPEIHSRKWQECATEFSFSRFLVPYLCEYKGWALFIDCDMLFRGDVVDLFNEAWDDPSRAVYVVKHNQKCHSDRKFLGLEQKEYPRKNWSSVMLFNNTMCEALTPEYVREATGRELHQFEWVKDDLIGELDSTWNHLVGDSPPRTDAKNVHYTYGGPWFTQYQHVEYAGEWWDAYYDMTTAGQIMTMDELKKI